MNTTTAGATRPAPAAASPAPTPKPRRATPKVQVEGVSREARQQAAALLEVLAGVRTPAEVAQQLAVSLTRYDLIEGRALQGLLRACEPRPQGRVRSPASELAALRRECEQLRRQVARQQALLRVTERTMGLAAAPAAASTKADQKSPKKRRQRKPKARALQAAAALQEVAEPVAVDPGGSP